MIGILHAIEKKVIVYMKKQANSRLEEEEKKKRTLKYWKLKSKTRTKNKTY